MMMHQASTCSIKNLKYYQKVSLKQHSTNHSTGIYDTVVFYLYLGNLKVSLLLKSTELLDIFQLYELLLYFYG